MSDQPQDTAVTVSAPSEVYDADEEVFVEVTDELRNRAEQVLHNMADSVLETAYWLTVALDEKLYLVAGVETRKDFMENHLPFSKRTGERYVSVARKWFPALRAANGEVPTVALPSNPTDGDLALPEVEVSGDGTPLGPPKNVPAHVANMGMTKLHQFARLPSEDLRHYVETGELPAREGREGFSVEEVEDMSARRAQRIVSDRLQPHKDKAEEEKEKRLKAEAERDALREELEQRKEQIAVAEDLEATFGPKATKLADKRRMMDQLQEKLCEVTRLVNHLGLTPDDPVEDQNRGVDIVSHIERLDGLAKDELYEVMLNPDRHGQL